MSLKDSLMYLLFSNQKYFLLTLRELQNSGNSKNKLFAFGLHPNFVNRLRFFIFWSEKQQFTVLIKSEKKKK
jgi:hypothetical protein